MYSFAVILVVLLVLILAPLASIASVNVLFGTQIAYTFWTWLASLWITGVLSYLVSK